LQAVAGFDRRRSLPELHRNHLRKWFSTRPLPPALRPSVLLLDDCFTTFQEPHIGRAAVELIERLGYRVELAGVCCGRAMISKGFLTDARELARKALPALAKAAGQGMPILGLEPSCLLTLADEWPELVPGPEAKAVAAAVELAETWAGQRIRDSGSSLALPAQAGKVLFHPHCHQRALVGPGGSADAMRLIDGVDVTVLDAGCCGMAGSFGYETQHYDLSVQVANLELVPALNAAPEAAVVATGTSCRHQIKDLTGRRALHPIEVLAGTE
jgi:Fe-S oxidoreductase